MRAVFSASLQIVAGRAESISLSFWHFKRISLITRGELRIINRILVALSVDFGDS